MLVNVPKVSINTMSRVDMRWVVQRLQRFLKQGRTVVAGVKLCGNAPVVMLDALKHPQQLLLARLRS